MKAIVPVAGAGTMLRPHTHTQPKALIPVAGKPLVSHIVEGLQAAGIQDFVFVIGYLGDKIQQYIEATYRGRLNYSFVRQEPRLGLAHAIYLCKDHFVGTGRVPVIALGDTIIDTNLSAFLASPTSVVSVAEVDTPGDFGVVEVDDKGLATRLIEKPLIPKSNLALVGLYKILEAEALFAALAAIVEPVLAPHRNDHPQTHLTDALMALVAQGVPIATARVNSWFDCGEKETLLATNQLLLRRASHPVPHARYPGVLLIPPVYVPESCTLEHAIIGPFVAIGENATVRRSIVQNTIVGDYATLEDLVLRDSLVGNDTTLRGRWQAVNIGDNTEIDFNV